MNAQEASAFGAIEDRIAQLASDSMHLVNTNAVLQLRLEAMERRLHSDQAELQQVKAELHAALREMDNAQRRYADARAKLDAVPFNDIRRCLRDVDFDSEHGDRVFAWMKNATQDGVA